MSQMWAEIMQQPDVIARALKANATTLDRIRSRTPPRVRLIGHGTSGHAGAYGALVLENHWRCPCDLVAPPDRNGGAAIFGKGDLVIALSQSGETPSIVAAAHRARRAGAEVVVVVNSAESDLAAAADHVLDCCAGPELAIPATKTFTAQVALLLALAAGTSDASRVVAPMTELLSAPPADVVQPSLVVGVESGAPIAAEVALKFAEAAGLGVRGLEAAEALHGPISAGDGTVMLIGGRDSGNLAAIAAARHAHWLDVVGRGLGSGVPEADVLVCAVWGQVLAHNLALSLGRHPDHPTQLSKVTATL